MKRFLYATDLGILYLMPFIDVLYHIVLYHAVKIIIHRSYTVSCNAVDIKFKCALLHDRRYSVLPKHL